MRVLLIAALALLVCSMSHAGVAYVQTPSATGGLLASSWVNPNGSDADMYVYDNFTLPSSAKITEIDWRGGYIYNAPYGRVNDFSVTFFESTAGGFQPHVTNPQLPEIFLAHYDVGGIAGETPAGTFGGQSMYDYRYVLPTAFSATGKTKYWVRIEASQPIYPDWGIAAGTGGDNRNFRFSTGAAMFQIASGDAAFTLRTSDPVPNPAPVPDANTLVLLIFGAPVVIAGIRRRVRS